jgi:hypothetical protein
MATTGSRTLKLSLLADVAEFTKNLKVASKDTESIGDQFTAFGKKAAVAFAAAGAAIGAFALASVKAAAEDEVGQRKLEETIRNTTNATAEQIAGIDKYITKQSIATNTTDEVLRPALSRLILSTKDVTKAQELLTLAQEIAAARSLPLETVTNALGKAYDGSNTALSKLGTGIDKATLKTLTFDETQQLLNKTFDGFIENQSTTAAFKFGQITKAVDESKEAIGAALLPIVKEFADFLIVSVVPAIEAFVSGLTGTDSLVEGLSKSELQAVSFGKKVRSVLDTVVDLKDELLVTAAVIGTVFVVSKISAAVVSTIALIKSLITAYNLLKGSAIVAGVASAFALNPLLGVGAVALGASVLAAAAAISRNSDTDTGQLSATQTYSNISGVLGSTTTNKPPVVPKITVPGSTRGGGISNAASSASKAAASVLSGIGQDDTAAFAESTPGVPMNITINQGIIGDPEQAARTIVDVVNRSFFRGTGGANAFVTA